MLANRPFAGSYPILQPFGVAPALHAQFACAGVALRGHEGIDFALPSGTPVLAVQAGTVAAAAQNERFGRFVVLLHVWGQSIYANLSEISVQPAEAIAAGQAIGKSGATNASNTAQLHFGMRISPYSLTDGWCGFSDPMPYLDRIDTPRGSIISPHILGGAHRHFPILQVWQPRVVLVVDPNPDEMRELRRICPHTVIVGRVFATDNEVSNRINADPGAAAKWAHELVLSRMTPNVDYWQVANEVMQSVENLPHLVNFELARMSLAEGSGYRCAILSFSTGSPDLPENDRMAVWKLAFPALQRAENNGHIVAIHQYGAPSMREPTVDWHTHRLEHQVLRRLPFKRLQFVVSEFGLDGLLTGPDPRGWQQMTNARDYVDQLKRAGNYCERFSGRVLGYCVFSLGVTGRWGTYDISGEVAEMLATESARGTWSQIDTRDGGLATGDGDSSTLPGGAAPTIPGVPPAPIARRITPWFDHYNMAIKSIAERADNPQPPAGEEKTSWIIKDVFTTMNGSWEPNDQPGSIPQWARDTYLSSDFADAGADHNIFAAVLDKAGNLIKGREVRFWSDGFAKLGDSDYDGYVIDKTRSPSGWVGVVLFSSSNFVPERKESGCWCWTAAGRAEVMTGGGLPANHHLSTFVVWQEVMDDDSTEPPVDPPEPPKTSPTDPDGAKVGTWVDDMRIGIKRIAERPDNPQGEVVYEIAQIFTTCAGSWEPSENFGSVDQWARDAWLRPLGAPDFFDDAGADHHLFAAIIGLDGKLMREYDILFWSDGFAQLGKPEYQGYVHRATKAHSGWANIPMSPGANFYPESGQQGPWCWAPAGASEVIVGGGMPANRHISIFCVWKAVQNTRVTPPGDNNIFLPWVSSRSGEASLAEETPGELPIPPVVEPSVVEPTLIEPQPPIDPGLEGDLPTPDPETPTPPPAAPPDETEDDETRRLRIDAWLRVGIESAHDTALAMYARRVGLGMPVTHEFESGAWIAQGFAGGIAIMAKSGEEQIRHIAW